jgi:uncharacterized protein YdeI (YjbR/CyaY-like superfamily)
MKPRYFKSPAQFRGWLERHHGSTDELLVGFHKVRSSKASMTWSQSVEEALCFGWIDGVRTRIDDARYCVRFTPRRPHSTWSAINIRKIRALIAQGRMHPAGLKAFGERRENRSGIYSYEQRPADLVEPYAGMLAGNTAARQFFSRQVPSYRRAATWWVISAKKEETRLKRVGTLIDLSARRCLIPQFIRSGQDLSSNHD